jgi:hypothetical protein
MNGATEATLAELLATANAMNVNLIKLQNLISKMSAPGAGGTTGGSGTTGAGVSSAAGLLSSFNPLSLAFGALKGIVGGISSVFGALGSVVGTVVGGLKGVAVNLYDFAKGTADGTSKLSEFYAAFSGLPVLGTFFGILSSYTAYQERLLGAFQQLTDSGANFSGSLSDMRASAARAFMSMDDFSKIVKSNSDLFATMGGNVQSGVNKFVDIAGRLYGPNSKYGNMLAGLGYTAETAAETLALYMRAQGTMNKQGLDNTEKITKGAYDYAVQLNTLSQLTGESNAELRKKLQKVQMEEAFQIYLSTLSPDQAEKVNAAMAERMALGGEEAAQSLKNSLLGINVAQTEQQRAIEVQTGGMLTRSNEDIRAALAAGKSKEEIVAMERRNAIESGTRAMELNKNLNASMGAVGIQQFTLATAQYTKTLRSVKDFEGLTAAEKKIRLDQQAAAAGSAAALEQAQKGIRNFGDEILTLVYNVIKPFVPELKTFATAITQAGIQLLVFVGKHMPDIIAGVKSIASWFKETYIDLKAAFDKGGWSGLFKTLGEKIGEGLSKAGDFLEPIVTALKPQFEKAFNVIFDSLDDFIYKKSGGLVGEGSKNRKEREAAEQTDQYKSWLENQKKKMFGHGTDLLGLTGWQPASDQDIYEEYKNQHSSPKRGQVPNQMPTDYNPRARRHSGTLGMTGSWWEKKDATLDIQAGESVVTQDQMAQITGQNGVAEGIQQLNSLTAQLLAVMKQNTDYTQRNYNATKELGGNLFATV